MEGLQASAGEFGKETIKLFKDVGEQHQKLAGQTARFLTKAVRPEDKQNLHEAWASDNVGERVKDTTLATAAIMAHLSADATNNAAEFLKLMGTPGGARIWWEQKQASVQQLYQDVLNNEGAGDRTRGAAAMMYTTAALSRLAKIPAVDASIGNFKYLPGALGTATVGANNSSLIVLGVHDINDHGKPIKGGLEIGGGLLDAVGTGLGQTNPVAGSAAEISAFSINRLGQVMTNMGFASDTAEQNMKNLLETVPIATTVPVAPLRPVPVGMPWRASSEVGDNPKYNPFKSGLRPTTQAPGPTQFGDGDGDADGGSQAAVSFPHDIRDDCTAPIHQITRPY
jgi:hypothetical protein